MKYIKKRVEPQELGRLEGTGKTTVCWRQL